MDNIDVDGIVGLLEGIAPIFGFFQVVAEWIANNIFGKLPGLADTLVDWGTKLAGWIGTLTKKA